MAKLKAPLFSFGASQQIGKALVYFGWKGLDVVREYVVPSNPQTTAQTTHRAYLTAVVAAIHAAQALGAQPLTQADITAYAALASTNPTPRTWFNEVCKRWIDQRVAGLRSVIYRSCINTEEDGQLSVDYYCTEDGANEVTAGDFWYGTSKTAMINSQAGVDQGAGRFSATIAGLTNGTKYYVQFRPTAHADFVGVRSGIYYGTPSA